MDRLKRDDKILVAMSGGVDSSATATLLKREGFFVAGAFMRLGDDNLNAEKEAKRIAKKLSIDFYSVDLREEFKREIIDDFLNEYVNGNTPNPCVNCNQKIKTGLFLEKAISLGFDYVATGHYAIIRDGSIYRGVDKEKDQSYFLWRLSHDQIKRLIFPLGDYRKEDVRKIDADLKMSVLDMKESMEVCFAKDSLNKFLLKEIGEKPGKIIDGKKEVGNHSGLWFYTIGQRKGIGLSGGPYFVTEKDYSKNILMVGKNFPELKSVHLKDLNWLSYPKFPFKCEVQIRYRHSAAPALISFKDGATVIFNEFQKATASGQSAVIYQGDQLIGGGIIC
ncbi:MAG: tRNA 2-thiouridine(34) synthase MnmA [Minisyncoccales bacterium]